MTIRDILTTPPYLLRELVFQGEGEKWWGEGRFLSLGALAYRVKSFPIQYGFRSYADFRRSAKLTKKAPFALQIYKLSIPTGLTPEELDDIEAKRLHMSVLMRLFLSGRTREGVFHYLKMPPQEMSRLLITSRGGEVKSNIVIRAKAEVAALVMGLKRVMQQTYGLTQDQAMLVPFLLYKATVESKPTQRVAHFIDLLEEFRLPLRIAQALFPAEAARIEKGRKMPRETDFIALQEEE